MKNCEYWIWLARTLGDAARLDEIIACFGNARELYYAGKNEWRLSGVLTAVQIEKLAQYSPSESGKIINDCEKNRWSIITPEDGEYPPLLREISNLPAVLYADGDASLLSDSLTIAMVGTRKASRYGIRAAGVIASMLSRSGFCVVSGGALGIDSAAHSGAISAGGKTVCVLGCGFGTDYLKSNEAMRNEIVRNGVIITEYPPFTQASRTTFPKRNRIISGMSLGTVVIEAGEKSGSLITANMALEQNRQVFAVPGNVFSSAYNGANKLIHDGAKPVFTTRDIVEEYYNDYPQRIKTDELDIPLAQAFYESEQLRQRLEKSEKQPAPVKRRTKSETSEPVTQEEKPVKKELPPTLGEAARAVYGLLESPMPLDEIVEKSGMSVTKTLAALTELEMIGAVELLPGNKYKRI